MTPELAQPTCPPPDLLHSLLGGGLRGLGNARVMRMHFPKNRPVQIHLHDDRAQWIAEWVGPTACERARDEAARLAEQGQRAVLRADARLGLVTRQPGADLKLPGLRIASDAGLADRVLRSCGLTGPFEVTLVAHRLGKRAVLRIRHARGTAFARLRSPSSPQARLAGERHRALWEALRRDPRIGLPEPMGEDAALGVVVYRALPGRTPHFAGLRGFADMEAITRAIHALQGCDLAVPPHGVADELAVLDGWLARLAPFRPDLAQQVAPRLARVGDALRALPPTPDVLCHRDLHEGQILLQRGRAGLLDFDTLRRGDPALDLGNLQAHLLLAGLRRGCSMAAFVTAAERTFPSVPLSRLTLWREAALLRLAMIYAFSAQSPAPSEALLDMVV